MRFIRQQYVQDLHHHDGARHQTVKRVPGTRGTCLRRTVQGILRDPGNVFSKRQLHRILAQYRRTGIRLGQPRKALLIHKPIEVRDGERYALLMPDNQPRVTVSIDFSEPAIGAQTLSVNTDDRQLRDSISPARTFGFMHEVEQLRARGLALGGSLNNDILVDSERVVNPEGLRFADEFVRHKLLTDKSAWSMIGIDELNRLQHLEPATNDESGTDYTKVNTRQTRGHQAG